MRLKTGFERLCRTHHVVLFVLEFLDFGLKFLRTPPLTFFGRLSVLDKAIDQQILNFSDPRAFLWRENLVLFQLMPPLRVERYP